MKVLRVYIIVFYVLLICAPKAHAALTGSGEEITPVIISGASTDAQESPLPLKTLEEVKIPQVSETLLEDGKNKFSGGIFINEKPPAVEKPRFDNHKAGSYKGNTSINFINADIREVARAVFGDMLGINYVLAPNIQGTVTIKINQPLPKEEILPAISSAFRLNGFSVVGGENYVKIVPMNDALRESGPFFGKGRSSSSSGFGVQIVPLRFTSVEEIRKVLDPISPSGSIIPVETGRNVLLLSGSEAERQSMADLIATFDVDWLSGTSFGLFPLKEVNAKSLVPELWEVLGTASGPLGKVLRLVPLERLNAVVAISRQQEYIHQVKAWIDRLDFDQNPNDQKIWVYPVQNGRAAILGDTLSKLISGKGMSENKLNSLSEGTGTSNLPSSDMANLASLSLGHGASGRQMRIIADDATNSLILMGTKSDFTVIESALKKLDIIPMQVKIEAVVAEVSLTDELQYGIQYLFKKHEFTSLLSKTNSTSISPTLPGFSTYISGSNISAILDLLKSVTNVHVVSSPQVTILNNQTATLQVGDQVPVATQTSVSTATSSAPLVSTIQMVDTGVILKVTPRVNSSGMVIMDISQEVSGVTKTTSSDLDSPTIQQRKIASSIAVRDGQTIALGGLITDNATTSREGIPGFQDLPLIGSLFSSTDDAKSRTELLALITPHVIKTDVDIREVTEEMRRNISGVSPLLEARPQPTN